MADSGLFLEQNLDFLKYFYKEQRVIFLFSDMIVLTKKRKTSYEFREVLTLRQTRTRVLGMPDLHPFGLALYHSQTGKILMQLSSRNRDEQGDLMSTINMLEVQVDLQHDSFTL